MKFYTEPSITERGSLSSIVEIESRDLIQENPWDAAHALVKSRAEIGFAEPLMDYTEDIGLPDSHAAYIVSNERGGIEFPEPIFDPDWAGPEPPAIWHLGEGFSGLTAACERVTEVNPDVVIRVAHLDTGYDPNHSVTPNIRIDLQRNFVEEDRPNDATDPNSSQGLISNPGHGTGTSCILAGGSGKIPTGEIVAIGAAPFVEVVPCRISNSVVLIKTDAFVDAMNYVISLHENQDTRVHVVTMSMGGVASKAWAEVINKAYEKGIFVVTAAGNNFGRATPRTLIYPARFNRVVAACGGTFDQRPYSKVWGTELTEMQGNFGPLALMNTALSAYSPNMPWAQFGTTDRVSLQGAGTSSATPQIAAAAAIYWKKYYHELMALDGWKRVETIRQALFQSADLTNIHSIEGQELDDEKKRFFFGRGCIKAVGMLKLSPSLLSSTLKEEDKDKVFLPFWRVVFGTRDLIERDLDPEEEMYQIEILQLIQISPRLQEILNNEEKTIVDLNEVELREFINVILGMEEASESLKMFLGR
ncbi:S8/S53 family peptidase [Dyadobacter sp. 32]|uniref:S8 family peptidase n=1 Tax=Dyadobacter sp. 32 TaxID=538966 RepID=UPI0011EC9493